jgi:hypothetical protein
MTETGQFEKFPSGQVLRCTDPMKILHIAVREEGLRANETPSEVPSRASLPRIAEDILSMRSSFPRLTAVIPNVLGFL